MKFTSFICLLGSIALMGSVNALPITSDEPSSELVVQCGIPAEFAVTTPLSLPAPQLAPAPAPVVVSQAAASPAAVPEPSTLGLIALGLVGGRRVSPDEAETSTSLTPCPSFNCQSSMSQCHGRTHYDTSVVYPSDCYAHHLLWPESCPACGVGSAGNRAIRLLAARRCRWQWSGDAA